jgi:hypothetical protein
MRGRRRRDAPHGFAYYHGLQVWISRSVGYIGEHEMRRVYRNAIGDWCAEIYIAGKLRVEVLDHHPTVATMRGLKAGGTDIADDVISQGAEGEDMRWRASLSAYDP